MVQSHARHVSSKEGFLIDHCMSSTKRRVLRLKFVVAPLTQYRCNLRG
jgi:hypothetical protein